MVMYFKVFYNKMFIIKFLLIDFNINKNVAV